MVELSTELLVELGGWPALKEARGLVERGKVMQAEREGALLRGRVQGAEKVHEAQIRLGERVAAVEVRCSCVESRRNGRVCAHALAVGIALLKAPADAKGAALKAAPLTTPASEQVVAPTSRATVPGAHRWTLADAPADVSRLEVTFILPLNLRENLARDYVRVILEAGQQPWDTALRNLKSYAVGEEDDRALAALEEAVGELSGITQVPRARMGALLHALGGHPRVWSGRRRSCRS